MLKCDRKGLFTRCIVLSNLDYASCQMPLQSNLNLNINHRVQILTKEEVPSTRC